MVALFEEIESLVKKLDYYPYMETVSYHWCKTPDSFSWVNSEGEVYAAEFNQGTLSRDDCVIVNSDNGCGETITTVFLKDMELSEDDFYDKYEG